MNREFRSDIPLAAGCDYAAAAEKVLIDDDLKSGDLLECVLT